jgi:hypothetical protein
MKESDDRLQHAATVGGVLFLEARQLDGELLGARAVVLEQRFRVREIGGGRLVEEPVGFLERLLERHGFAAPAGGETVLGAGPA